jgi:hypothetical protein
MRSMAEQEVWIDLLLLQRAQLGLRGGALGAGLGHGGCLAKRDVAPGEPPSHA